MRYPDHSLLTYGRSRPDAIMHDLSYFREHLDVFAEMAKRRNVTLDLDGFRALDKERRELITANEQRKALRNKASDEIARLKKEKQSADPIIAEMKQVSEQIKASDERIAQLDATQRELLLIIPNIPHRSVPTGVGPEDNQEVRRWGSAPKFDFEPKPHWEVGERAGMIPAATKITGARFAIYEGWGARLERWPISFSMCTPANMATRNSSSLSGEYRIADGLAIARTRPFIQDGEQRFLADAYQRSRPPQFIRRNFAQENPHSRHCVDGMLPLRSRCCRKGHPRHSAPAPVSKSRAFQIHPSRKKLPRARNAGSQRRNHSSKTRTSLPHRFALLRRYGLRFCKNLRHRSLVALEPGVSRNLILLELRSFPSTPRRHPLQAKGRRQERIRAYPERFRPGRRPHLDRGRRKLPAGRRVDSGSRSPTTLYGRGTDSSSWLTKSRRSSA